MIDDLQIVMMMRRGGHYYTPRLMMISVQKVYHIMWSRYYTAPKMTRVNHRSKTLSKIKKNSSFTSLADGWGKLTHPPNVISSGEAKKELECALFRSEEAYCRFARVILKV
mmetsp:Transcript_2334/g.3659  ORF Transcript_2334/g.3659 Transcript_2334/m.3659 type:complete len:111 (-) Transcript_2334:1035-1367(-)